MGFWSLTCAVYPHVFLKKGTNIQKAGGGNSLHIVARMNKDLTWKFQPLISSRSKGSCQSIFIIYNDLSDSSPSDNNGVAVRDEILVPNLCRSGDQKM